MKDIRLDQAYKTICFGDMQKLRDLLESIGYEVKYVSKYLIIGYVDKIAQWLYHEDNDLEQELLFWDNDIKYMQYNRLCDMIQRLIWEHKDKSNNKLKPCPVCQGECHIDQKDQRWEIHCNRCIYSAVHFSTKRDCEQFHNNMPRWYEEECHGV